MFQELLKWLLYCPCFSPAFHRKAPFWTPRTRSRLRWRKEKKKANSRSRFGHKYRSRPQSPLSGPTPPSRSPFHIGAQLVSLIFPSTAAMDNENIADLLRYLRFKLVYVYSFQTEQSKMVYHLYFIYIENVL